MDQACKIDMEEMFQSMQVEPQLRYDLSDLTYDTQFTVSNLSNENFPETDNSELPESDGYNESSIATKSVFYDNWILWISGICILVLSVLLMIKKTEGKRYK